VFEGGEIDVIDVIAGCRRGAESDSRSRRCRRCRSIADRYGWWPTPVTTGVTRLWPAPAEWRPGAALELDESPAQIGGGASDSNRFAPGTRPREGVGEQVRRGPGDFA